MSRKFTTLPFLVLFCAFSALSQNYCPNFNLEAKDFSYWDGKVGCPSSSGPVIDYGCPTFGQPSIDVAQGVDGMDSQHEIITKGFNGGNDPYIPGLKMVSPLGGDYIARLGNYTASTVVGADPWQAQAAELTYQFTVDSSNILLQVAYAIALYNPSGHSDAQRPYFSIRVLDDKNNSIKCMEYEVMGKSSTPGFKPHGSYVWRDWTIQTIYLGAYFGQKVTLQLQSSDCSPAAHPGWAYVDASCSQFGLLSSEPKTCAGKPVKLSAPVGMNVYEWRFGSAGGPVVATTRETTTETPGQYYCTMVPLSTSGVLCPFTLEIEVKEENGYPLADFDAIPNPVCLGDSIQFQDLTTVTDNRSIQSWSWDFGDNAGGSLSQNPGYEYSAVGTYNVELIVVSSTSCVDTVVQPVQVIPVLDPQIDSIGPFCHDDPTVQMTVNEPNGTWVSSAVDANGVFDPFAGHASGENPVLVRYEVGQCGEFDETYVIVEERIVPEIEEVDPLCEDEADFNLSVDADGGLWSGNGILDSNSGLFSPSTAGVGTHEIVYAIGGLCPSSDTIFIQIERRKVANIGDVYGMCMQDTVIQLSAVEPNGVWSGSGIIDTQQGLFNPSAGSLGQNRIIYTVNGLCPDAEAYINVFSNPNPVFSMPAQKCSSDNAFTLTANTPGGVWSGDGIVDQVNGVYDPSQASLGVNEVTYTIPGGCGGSHSENITIVRQKIADIIVTDTIFCVLNAPFNFQPQEFGGTWSGPGITDANQGTFAPSVAGPGYHRIYHVMAQPCGDTDYVDIRVDPQLDATITAVDSICKFQAPVQFTAVDQGGIWQGPGITDAQQGWFDPSTANLGANYITYQISGDCGDADTVMVYVLQAKNPTITPIGPFCYDAVAVPLNAATPGGTWSGIGVSNGNFIPGSVPVGKSQVKYSFTGRCPSADSIQVERLPQLIASQFQITNVKCHGDCNGEISFNTSGGYTNQSYNYLWAPVPSNTSQSESPKGFCEGNYTLTLIDSVGCRFDSTLYVSEPQQLVASTFTKASNCGLPDGEVGLMATPQGGTPPYNYTWLQSPKDTTVLSGVPGDSTYSVIVNDANGCSLSLSDYVNDIPGPTMTLNVDSVSCFAGNDGAAQITQITNGTPAYQYFWDGVQDTSSQIVGLSAGLHHVEIKDGNNCTARQDFNVYEPTLVTVQPTFSDTTICVGQQVQLSAIANEGNGNPYQYFWSDENGTITSTVIKSAGTFYVYAQDAKGCVSNTKTVDVKLFDPISITMSHDTVICPGQRANFSVEAEGGLEVFQYNWSNSGYGSSSTHIEPEGENGDTVWVSVTVSDGCSPEKVDSAKVTFHESPKADFIAFDRAGCEPVPATLINTSTLADSVIWNINGEKINVGPTNNVFKSYDAGSYSVSMEVWSSNGCYDIEQKPAYINAYPYPKASFGWEPSPPTIIQNEVTFINYSLGDVAQSFWTLTGHDSIIMESTDHAPTYAFLPDTASYRMYLRVVSSHGCADSINQRIKVEPDISVFIPNAISPNGDGANEFFFVEGYGFRESHDFELLVHDRWGKLLFEGRSKDQKWDGTYKGEKVKTDTYVWTLRVRDWYGIKYFYQGSVSVLK